MGETQALYPTSLSFVSQSLPVTTQVLNPSSPPFIPQPLQPTGQISSLQGQLAPQTLPTSMPMLWVQNGSDLVNILAEAISANHLPTPEPALFSGDPLKFKDWQLSFQTLIDRKNIPKNEKFYYLRKYLGGAAKKAVEKLFLLGTEEASLSGWNRKGMEAR